MYVFVFFHNQLLFADKIVFSRLKTFMVNPKVMNCKVPLLFLLHTSTVGPNISIVIVLECETNILLAVNTQFW